MPLVTTNLSRLPSVLPVQFRWHRTETSDRALYAISYGSLSVDALVTGRTLVNDAYDESRVSTVIDMRRLVEVDVNVVHDASGIVIVVGGVPIVTEAWMDEDDVEQAKSADPETLLSIALDYAP